jgi:small subunit ribosomal protein S4
MRNYYLNGAKKKGNTGENLSHLLETRLDVLVLRTGFARSIHMARQLVVHGHITVDGKKVDCPSYAMKAGQVISVRTKSRELDSIKFAMQQAKSPAYLKVNDVQMTAELTYLPPSEATPAICEMPLVVEFYSR